MRTEPCRRRALVGRIAALAIPLALFGLIRPAGAQSTTTFSDLPCAVFVDLPAPNGSGTPFLPFTVPLCAGGDLTITTRSFPLRNPPFTDDPYYTGTFSFSGSGALHAPIDPAVNPGDFDGRFHSRTPAGWDLLLDFDVPIASFGMSTMMSRYFSDNVSDRMRLFDGPFGTGNLVAEVFSEGNPAAPYWHAVRFTGYNAGSPIIRSVVIDVQSDVDTRLFLDGLAFGTGEAPSGIAANIGPRTAALQPATPNPFYSRTTLRYDLPAAGPMRLTLYDVHGRWVRDLAEGTRSAGAHALSLDAGDLASGVYLVRLSGPDGLIRTQRITLTR